MARPRGVTTLVEMADRGPRIRESGQIVAGHRFPSRAWCVVCLLLCTLACGGCSRADQAWYQVRSTGVLRVGMDASFPPFESVAADGALIGYDVDLARELGRRLGLEVQFVANLPYDGLYDALAVGRVDVLISALVIDPDRTADFAYSPSYFDAGQVLVLPAAQAGIDDMGDLGGRTVAVEFGTLGDQEARAWARKSPELTIATYQTAAEALAAVAAREADCALVDRVSAIAELAASSSRATAPDETLSIVGEPAVPEPYAVVVRRESPLMLRAIEEALLEMQKDGTLKVLEQRWLE